MRSTVVSLGLFAATALAAAAQGGPDGLRAEPRGLRPGTLQLAPRVRLERIAAREITGGLAALALDAGPFRTTPGAFDFRPPQIRREVTTLWRYRTLDPDAAPALDVAYDLTARNGRLDRLSHRRRDDSEIRVQLVPQLPRVVDRRRRGTLIEGGGWCSSSISSP